MNEMDTERRRTNNLMGAEPNLQDKDHYRSLQILRELSKGNSHTQRDLSKRLGLALGLVNSYLKNLIAKGYITVTAIPPKRYTYYLTPKGLAESTRLTYSLLHDYTRIYRDARSNFRELFNILESEGAKVIIFAGADEAAEIAYLTLHEFQMDLIAVLDDDRAGGQFFKEMIRPLDAIKDTTYDYVIVTSYLKRKNIHKRLLDCGASRDRIKNVFGS